MKVFVSKYRSHWLSPYTILEKCVFWKKDYDPYDTTPPKWLQIICEGMLALLDTIHPRIEYVKIDSYDAWNAPETMGLIILPILKEVRNQKHGSPFTSDWDVPDELKSMNAPRVENEWDTDDLFHKRWEWVLDEIIFAFESLSNDWEDQFRTGESDWEFIKLDNGNSEMVKGPNDTIVYDWDGMKNYQERVQNGFRLFGVYYQNTWA